MLRKGFPLFCLFFAGLTFSLKAQDGSLVPALFDQFFNNYYLVNPANDDSTSSLKIRLGNRSLTGLFSGVNRIYFDADLSIKSKRYARVQSIGIQAINNREGEFFSKSRLYGRYSWQLKVSPGAVLSVGASIGFVNYAFRASSASPGGSSMVLDGNTGFWYLRKRFKAGLSMQQMFQGKLQPVNQSFTLNRFYNLNIAKFFPISPYLNLTTHLYSRFQNNEQEPVTIELASVFEIQRKVEAGFNYRHKNGISFLGGIKAIKIGSLYMSFMASYMASMRDISGVNDNMVEFFIGFRK